MRRYAFAVIALAVFTSAASAASVSFPDLDAAGAVAGTKDALPYGYVFSFQFGSKVMTPDLAVTNKVGQKLAAVGLLRSASWSMGPSDPIALTFVVSAANAQLLQSYLASRPANVATMFNFAVSDNDPATGWYRGFDSGNAIVNGIPAKSGTMLNVSVGPGLSTLPFQNSTITISIMPAANKAQQVFVGMPGGGGVIRAWGVAVQ
jgi:hypothetical protein